MVCNPQINGRGVGVRISNSGGGEAQMGGGDEVWESLPKAQTPRPKNIDGTGGKTIPTDRRLCIVRFRQFLPAEDIGRSILRYVR